MDFQEHYKNHLSRFYTWMFGNFETSVERQISFFKNNISIAPGFAIDLGCGSGFQSVALKRLGYEVCAVDLSEELLSELQGYDSTLNIRKSDIRDLEFMKASRPDLVVCMGDTLTHLPNKEDIARMIQEIFTALKANGQIVLSFRNLTSIPQDKDRFFIVRSTEDKILTCALEDEGERVRVNDLFYERISNEWNLKTSSYTKLKIDPAWVEKVMALAGFKVTTSKLPSGLDVLIGQK